MRILAEGGVPHELLDRAGVVRHEPGLAHSAHLLKGRAATARRPVRRRAPVHHRRLAERAEAAGVRFRFGLGIERLLHGPDSITGVQTSSGIVTADAYLATMGVHTARGCCARSACACRCIR